MWVWILPKGEYNEFYIYLLWSGVACGSVACDVDAVVKGLGVEVRCCIAVVEDWVTTSVRTIVLLSVYGDAWADVTAVFAESDRRFLPRHSILALAEIVRNGMMQRSISEALFVFIC